ncbi:hypothetical protein GG344DRAFT_84667 [Lentinula edodes]|nr:hypothetical protein GG344DRAFT_84667 [Lentinula edodes]
MAHSTSRAALTWFLATTDAVSFTVFHVVIISIYFLVSTSLPTIAADLEAESQYTWVGVAYLLTQTAFQPLYGRIADIVGRMSVISPDFQASPVLTLALDSTVF